MRGESQRARAVEFKPYPGAKVDEPGTKEAMEAMAEDGSLDLWEAYFILDEAKDLQDSKLWVKVQRPYIGGEVRDVTAIVVTEKAK